MASLIKISYPRRLFLWLLAYSFLLVGCFIGFQYHREKQFKIEELNDRLQLMNFHILDNVAKGDTISAVSFSDSFPFEELRVSIIDNEGKLVYDNSPDLSLATNHLQREEIAEALKKGSGYTVRRHSESTGNTYFYSATLGKEGYVVRTAVPYSVSLSGLLKADFGFLWVMGSVTIVMCLLGFFATRRLGLHIQRLNMFAEKAERGEKIYDTTPFPKDELGSISNHIVRLYVNLQNAITDRDKEHKTALHEQQEKQRIKKQLTNNINHELKTPVASIQVCLETLLTHKDLSEEKREEFLKRCLDNTDRLKHLLNDVSMITRMDDAPQSITKEPLDLTKIIGEVVEDCIPIASEKGIMIENDITHPIQLEGNRSLLSSVFRNLIDNAIAYSGGNRISIALEAEYPLLPENRNLANDRNWHENKILYKNRFVSEEGGKVMISVRDNGCGVADVHLSRIFERFYRIDKGRSRSAGGTGLGLSIVKNAVMLHGGTIIAQNQPGGGLKFLIILPL